MNVEKELLSIRGELRGYARYLVWDHDKADDLLQDTALKILTNAETFSPGTNFKGWTFAIMRNTFLNSVHRANPIVYLDDMSYNGSFAASMVSQQSSDRNLDLQDIYNAIDSLPASRSEVVYLLILGHKYDEIANILDIPTGTVKSRINASRNELRKILEDYFK